MADQASDSLNRPVGELWVELSRDEKRKVCDALIDRNQPDVLQEFASLVRFTRVYLHPGPTGSLQSSKDIPLVPAPPIPGAQTSSGGANKRKNDEPEPPFQPVKKAQLSVNSGPGRNEASSIWSVPTPAFQGAATHEKPAMFSKVRSTFHLFDSSSAEQRSNSFPTQTPSLSVNPPSTAPSPANTSSQSVASPASGKDVASRTKTTAQTKNALSLFNTPLPRNPDPAFQAAERNLFGKHSRYLVPSSTQISTLSNVSQASTVTEGLKGNDQSEETPNSSVSSHENKVQTDKGATERDSSPVSDSDLAPPSPVAADGGGTTQASAASEFGGQNSSLASPRGVQMKPEPATAGASLPSRAPSSSDSAPREPCVPASSKPFTPASPRVNAPRGRPARGNFRPTRGRPRSHKGYRAMNQGFL